MRDGARRDLAGAAVVAAVALLPFLRGLVSGASFYFRDLSLYFLPVRRFALEGLAAGEVRLWNPYVHEGVPLSLPAVGYPVDLLQLLRPDPAGISAVLALHVPLAALAFYALARGLSLGRVAAAGGALVYALGGFLLSSVNLYVHLQAAAWAPLVVLALAQVLGGRGRRAAAAAALAVAVALSTTGVEVAAQAVLAGVVVGGAGRDRRSRGLAALALGLGLAIAAPVLLLVGGQVEGSARGRGFPTDVVLAHSVHPFTLVQTVVGGLYGNLSNLAGEWWGDNFFPRGFPYVVSLYLGAATLALAWVGARSGHPLARRLAGLGALGLVVSLGRWSGLAPLVDGLPALHAFRFPVKAFFTVHLAVALLAATGLAALSAAGDRACWRRLAAAAGALGTVLVSLALLPRLPAAAAAFSRGFFPPRVPAEAHAALLARVLGDAALGGALALAVAAAAVVALRCAVPRPRATAAVAALVVADLLRTGAGLSPMATPAFFRPSPSLQARLPALRRARVFTCSVEETPAYLAARAARGADHEAWSFGLLLETLTPAFNVPLGVPTALSPDLTMLAPAERVFSPAEASCRDLDAILPRLREAAVATVLAVAPLVHPDLEPDGVLASPRVLPLAVHVYRLRRPRPRIEAEGARVLEARLAPDDVSLEVEASRDADLLVRDGWARGWTARVDGEPREVARASGGHRAVRVPAGRHRVEMEYRPRGLPVAAVASGAALAAAAALLARRRRALPARSALDSSPR